MTPSSTRAEAGEDASSMPSTPVPTVSSELPPPVYDLVPGNLKLAAGIARASDARSVSSAMSVSSSLVSQYDPASVEGREEGERPTNLNDVSEVSTPTGTPRQALRQLDNDSVAGSSRGAPSAPPSEIGDDTELREKFDTLNAGKGGPDGKDPPKLNTPAAASADKTDANAITPTAKDPETNSHLAAVEPVPLEAQITATPATADAPSPAPSKGGEQKGNASNSEPSLGATRSTEDQSAPLAALAQRADAAADGPKAEGMSDKAGGQTPADIEVGQDKAIMNAESERSDNRDKTPEAPEVAISPASEPDGTAAPTETTGRRSEETIMPSASISGLSASASQDTLSTPLATPKDGDSADAPSVIDLSGSPKLRTTDRDSTPVPRDLPKSQSILDESSDIVSMIAPSGRPFSDDLSQSQLDNLEDEMSNRSSMPPARASSELEFRYEDLHERFAGDSSKPISSSAHSRTHSGHSFTPAAAGGGALAAAAAPSDFRGIPSKTKQADKSVGDVASTAILEERFPSVPATDVNAKPPMQVHIEPPPFGPISDDDVVEEKKEEPKPARPESGTLGSGLTAPVLTFETVKDSTPDRRTPEFPDAPNNTLPNTPGTTTPDRSSTPNGSNATATTILAKSFPKVPDEEHPYVGVHISPQTKAPLNPKTPFPNAPDGGTPRSDPPSAPNRSAQGSPSKLSSAGSTRSLGVEPRGPKRLSYSPRPPELDDEDPGDFEGGGWAVVTKWEPWRGSPPRDRASGESSLGRGLPDEDVPPPVPPKD